MNEAVGHFKSDSGDTLSFCKGQELICVFTTLTPTNKKRGGRVCKVLSNDCICNVINSQACNKDFKLKIYILEN